VKESKVSQRIEEFNSGRSKRDWRSETIVKSLEDIIDVTNSSNIFEEFND
jgi:hypothetical protein